MGKIQRVGFGASTIGAMAAAAVLAAPSASAFVINVQLASNSPVVGCSDVITANVDITGDLVPVNFTDNGTSIGSASPAVGVNQATIKWTPTTAGKHTITASQPLSSKSIDVTVSAANPFSSGSGGVGCAATGGSFG
ncbi:Ig-like domain-containing protein [Nocardia sp. CDC160]|uniref:Ig-like domain-containing protein n=1 Tax=Nocardia sp. CDC160 TaxID=3112166 RepID=UPI002DBE9E5C|nr:Ig-like domain-containing protein [Nocardia sp. CDC160]MEC3914513.1 Ig-like domain-containing protein [Nocardia sp. CDC160]